MQVPAGQLLVRGADVMALDARAAGAEVTLDRCLLICTGRPVVEVVGKAGATPTIVRAVHSTLVADRRSCVCGRPAQPTRIPPFTGCSGTACWVTAATRDGALLDLQDGTGTSGMQWRAINCLYSGWARFSSAKPEAFSNTNSKSGASCGTATKEIRWLWNLARRRSARSIRDAGCGVSSGRHTRGILRFHWRRHAGLRCELLPPARDNWLSITYERVAPVVADLPAVDQAPAIPDLGTAAIMANNWMSPVLISATTCATWNRKRSFGLVSCCGSGARERCGPGPSTSRALAWCCF